MSRLASALVSILAMVFVPALAAQTATLAVASSLEVSDSTSHARPLLLDSDPPRISRAQLGNPVQPSAAALTRVPRHRFVLVGAATGGAAGLAWVLSRSSTEGLGVLALPVGIFVGTSAGAIAGGALGLAVSYVLGAPARAGR
jgi:hypothetical protein